MRLRYGKNTKDNLPHWWVLTEARGKIPVSKGAFVQHRILWFDTFPPEAYVIRSSGIEILFLKSHDIILFILHSLRIVSRGVMRSAASSYAYGGWFAPRVRHSVRMTHRPSAALRLLGSLRISHNKFLRANNKSLPSLPPPYLTANHFQILGAEKCSLGKV